MDPIPAEVELAFLRSGHRKRSVMMLSSLGEASPGQLARSLGLPCTRQRWIMEGDGRYYSKDLAPVQLGLATLIEAPRRRKYVITPLGRKMARRFTAREARRARRAAAIKRSDEAHRNGEPTPVEEG